MRKIERCLLAFLSLFLSIIGPTLIGNSDVYLPAPSKTIASESQASTPGSGSSGFLAYKKFSEDCGTYVESFEGVLCLYERGGCFW